MALQNETNVLEDFVGISEGNIQHMRDDIAENPYRKALIEKALTRSMKEVAATLSEIVGKDLLVFFVLTIFPLIVMSFIVFYKHAPTPGNKMIPIELINRIFPIGFGAILNWCFLSIIEQYVKTTKERREALVKRWSHLNDIDEGLSRTSYGTDFILERVLPFGASELVDLKRFFGIVYVGNFLFILSILILTIFEFILS